MSTPGIPSPGDPAPGGSRADGRARRRAGIRSDGDRPRTPGAWRARARGLGDRVPTRWLLTAATAVVLLASSAFGGLDDAPAEALPEVAAATPVTGAQLEITVERATVVDALPEQGVTPEDGKRLLAVIATVEDIWDGPVATSGLGADENVRPVGVPGIDAADDPRAVILFSDGTMHPVLQPHVPAQLAYVWEIDADALAGSQEITVDIYDKSYRADGFVTYGERFEDPFVQARTVVPLRDVGAGSGS